MTAREMLEQMLRDGINVKDMQDFIRDNKMTPEEAKAFIRRQRDLFAGYAVDFILLVNGFRERQDAHKDWNIDRTFRDFAQMRRSIDSMENFLTRVLEAEEWLT